MMVILFLIPELGIFYQLGDLGRERKHPEQWLLFSSFNMSRQHRISVHTSSFTGCFLPLGSMCFRTSEWEQAHWRSLLYLP
jgi:hypothetical protein